MSILFQGARLVDSRGERFGDLLAENGTITFAGEGGRATADRVVDARGLVLMPSFVDLHAHFRDPGLTHKEDIHSGCRAAVHGGYTAVHLMPNTDPVCSSIETVEYVKNKAAELGLCDVWQSVSITDGFDGVSLGHLADVDPGEVPWLTDDGNGVEPSVMILEAMQLAKARGFGLMLHEEDRVMTPIDNYLAEDLPTLRDVALAEFTGCRVHFCHVSTRRSIEAVIEGKKRGASVTCEVSPHHLYLNDGNPGRVAPPLRGEPHRRALIEAVKGGWVDAIATDHAPHTPEEKSAGANGFTGLDLAFATCYTVLVKGEQIPLSHLSRLMSQNPAGILGIPGGLLQPGAPANLVLVELDKPFVAAESHIHSKSKNSPLLGETLYGTVCMTIREGAVVYEAEIN